MDLTTFFTIAVASIFVFNFVLARFLGLCPFIGVSQKTSSALGMGAAVTFVMFLASVVTYLLYQLLLKPYGLEIPLKTPMFILVIATLVQLVEMFLRSRVPALYRSLGIYLPLITTNCAVMGVALLNTTDAPGTIRRITETGLAAGFFASAWQGICVGIGFTLAMLLMSGVRERLENADVPHCLKGTPIALICTGLMAMAFLGFTGMVSL
jgi:electron transport complex protein RnfA